MKRILVYGMTDNRGGMEAYIMNYFRKIDREKYMFDFVTDAPTIAYEEEISILGGQIFFIPSRRENLLGHMKRIRSIIKENGYSIVYYNLLSASAVFSVIAADAIKGVKLIVHSHNGSVDKMRNHLLLRPILNICTDVRLACSQVAAEFMFGKKYVNSTILVNNAIDIKKYRFDVETRENVRKMFGIENKFVVGHIGRLCYQKNTMFLLEVFSEILKKKDEVVLLLIGDGEDRVAVEEKIKELNIKKNVILTGMRSDIERLLQAMDVFLLPSRFEGLSVVLIEAQAAGLQIFASSAVSDASKITPLVEFINLEDSAMEWATKILLKEVPNRKNMEEYIRIAGYDIEEQVHQFEKLIDEL